MVRPPPPPDRSGPLLERLQAVASTEGAGCPLLVRVGAAVLDGLFDGSLAVFRAQARRSPELRRALRDPRFPIAPEKLTVAVRLADQHRALGGLARRLSCRHQLELLALRSDGARLDLARRCVAAGWSADALALRVRLDYGASASGVGRPRVAAADRLVRDVVERALASTLAEAVGRAPPARRHELARQLGEAADALRSLALSAGATEAPRAFPRGKS